MKCILVSRGHGDLKVHDTVGNLLTMREQILRIVRASGLAERQDEILAEFRGGHVGVTRRGLVNRDVVRGRGLRAVQEIPHRTAALEILGIDDTAIENGDLLGDIELVEVDTCERVDVTGQVNLKLAHRAGTEARENHGLRGRGVTERWRTDRYLLLVERHRHAIGMRLEIDTIGHRHATIKHHELLHGEGGVVKRRRGRDIGDTRDDDGLRPEGGRRVKGNGNLNLLPEGITRERH